MNRSGESASGGYLGAAPICGEPALARLNSLASDSRSCVHIDPVASACGVWEGGLTTWDPQFKGECADGVVESVGELEGAVMGGGYVGVADWLPLSEVVDEEFEADALWWDGSLDGSFDFDGAGGGGVVVC